jgi:hypothetical protein
MPKYKIAYSITNYHGFTSNWTAEYTGDLGERNYTVEQFLIKQHSSAKCINILEVNKL